jgi:hypothetical protein
VERDRCSERSACRHFSLHKSTFQYKTKEPDAWLAKLTAALRRVSRQHPEMGYPKITRLLKAEGRNVGARKIQHLRRELGLMGPPKKPRRRRQGLSTGLPTAATHRNHVWTWDFVHNGSEFIEYHLRRWADSRGNQNPLHRFWQPLAKRLQSITPIQFAGLALEASPLTVPATSVRRSLDFLYNLKEPLTTPGLTNYAAQFG